MGCKQGCPGGYEWREVGRQSHGCCSSFWSCFGFRRVCQREYPCNGSKFRRLDSDGDDVEIEEYEEIPMEDAESLHKVIVYKLDDSEYDEEELKEMSQDELDDFIEELASHPHEIEGEESSGEESSEDQDDDRRLESLTESRLKSVLEASLEN